MSFEKTVICLLKLNTTDVIYGLLEFPDKEVCPLSLNMPCDLLAGNDCEQELQSCGLLGNCSTVSEVPLLVNISCDFPEKFTGNITCFVQGGPTKYVTIESTGEFLLCIPCI